jgi:hypothetical protein
LVRLKQPTLNSSLAAVWLGAIDRNPCAARVLWNRTMGWNDGLVGRSAFDRDRRSTVPVGLSPTPCSSNRTLDRK